MAKTTFYVQVEPQFWKWEPNKLASISAVGLTKKRPTQSRGKSGTVVVKLTLDIPDSAFLPLAPEALVVVPEHLANVLPIKVEAVDGTDG